MSHNTDPYSEAMIEAAKKRVADAERWEILANKTFSDAEANMRAAEGLLLQAERNLNEAQEDLDALEVW